MARLRRRRAQPLPRRRRASRRARFRTGPLAREHCLDAAERRRIVAWRIFAPRLAIQHLPPSELVEPVHVATVERVTELLGEASGNVGNVVVDVIALADHVELVEIADALRADQGRDGPAGDLERAAIDRFEIRARPRIADDVEAALAVGDGLQQALVIRAESFEQIIARKPRWIEHHLGHRATLALHLLETMATLL